MRTYSFLEGGGYVVVLYAIEDIMLPVHVFFFFFWEISLLLR